MDDYPKLINIGGVSVTVKDADDEAHWRGQSSVDVTASAPETDEASASSPSDDPSFPRKATKLVKKAASKK